MIQLTKNKGDGLYMVNNRVQQLRESWKVKKRWKGIKRPYSAEEVIKLRGSIDIEYTLLARVQKSYGSS